jgi:aminoglycoside 2'-N-acetyltransferase I
VAHFPQADVPTALRSEVLALRRQAWPDGTGENDPALSPLWVLLLVGGEVVASLSLLSKSLNHDGQSFRATGLSAVVTGERWRGRGYGLALVTATKQLMDADLAIFTCDDGLVPFYERAGFHVLTGTVLVGGTPAEPLRSDQFSKTTMSAFLSRHAREHASSFTGSDVELYPGALDRLW